MWVKPQARAVSLTEARADLSSAVLLRVSRWLLMNAIGVVSYMRLNPYSIVRSPTPQRWDSSLKVMGVEECLSNKRHAVITAAMRKALALRSTGIDPTVDAAS